MIDNNRIWQCQAVPTCADISNGMHPLWRPSSGGALPKLERRLRHRDVHKRPETQHRSTEAKTRLRTEAVQLQVRQLELKQLELEPKVESRALEEGKLSN